MTDVSYNLCIICQESSKTDTLRKATEQSLKTMQDSTYKRKKLRIDRYRDAIDRLEVAFRSDDTARQATETENQQCRNLWDW